MTVETSHEVLHALCDVGETRAEVLREKVGAAWRVSPFFFMNFDERVAYMVANLDSQWLNGGIQQWYDNGHHLEYGRDLLGALHMIGEPTCLRVIDMVEEAEEVYESDEFVECDDEDDDYNVALAQLEKLDEEYYAMDGKLVDEVVAWLGKLKE